MHTMNEKTIRRGIALGSLILTCLVMPQVYWLFVGYSEVTNWEKALWTFFAGGVFFLSFFFREQTFLFRSILWVFRTIHIPPGEWLAIVYGVVFVAMGLFFLLA